MRSVVPQGDNPRKYGFNYGTGGAAPKPAIYYAADVLAQRLRAIAGEASAKAWEVDRALWRVRVAETEDEKRAAIAALDTIVASHQIGSVPD